MPTSNRNLQYGSPTKMNVVPVTIGALAPTNDTLASFTWRDPARPDACSAPSMMCHSPWMRPVPRLPPNVLSGSSPSSSMRPSWMKSSASPSLQNPYGLQPVDHRGREPVVDLRHVDILRAEPRPLPGQLRRTAAALHVAAEAADAARHLEVQPLPVAGEIRRPRLQIARAVRRRQHDGDRALHRDVAVEQAERIRHHARREVVLARQLACRRNTRADCAAYACAASPRASPSSRGSGRSARASVYTRPPCPAPDRRSRTVR